MEETLQFIADTIMPTIGRVIPILHDPDLECDGTYHQRRDCIYLNSKVVDIWETIRNGRFQDITIVDAFCFCDSEVITAFHEAWHARSPIAKNNALFYFSLFEEGYVERAARQSAAEYFCQHIPSSLVDQAVEEWEDYQAYQEEVDFINWLEEVIGTEGVEIIWRESSCTSRLRKLVWLLIMKNKFLSRPSILTKILENNEEIWLQYAIEYCIM